MTDKIIIDGVDVSECEYFLDNSCMSVENYNDYCIENKGCLYKQLQRLQQENEELKIYIESNKQQVKEVETLVMDNDRLLQENERLQAELKNEKEVEKILNKTLNDTANKLDKILQTNKKQQEIIDAYKLTIIEGKEIIDNYEQALEEIREIINCRFKPETEYYTLGFKEYDEIIEDIDKIVSEVLND